MSYGSSGNNCKTIFDNNKSENLYAEVLLDGNTQPSFRITKQDHNMNGTIWTTNFRGSHYGISFKILYLALKIVFKVDLSDAVMFQYYQSSSISILVEIIIQNCKVAFSVRSSFNGCNKLKHLMLYVEIHPFSTELYVQASRRSFESNRFFRLWWNPYALDCKIFPGKSIDSNRFFCFWRNPYALDCKTFPGISLLCLHEIINNQESASNIDTQSQIMDLTL